MSRPVAHAEDGARHAPFYAEVAVVPAIPGKDLLTYRVDDSERARVCPGVRVLVPLGSRHETGLVVAVGTTPTTDARAIRGIAEVLDREPILTDELVELCRWAARYHVTSLADVLATALPGGMRASTAREVALPAGSGAAAARGPIERAVVEHLAAHGPTSIKRLGRALGRRGVASAVRALAARGAVETAERVRAAAATTRRARVLHVARPLTDDEAAALARRAPKRHAVYAQIAAAPDGRLDATALAPPARAAAAALVRSGVLGETRAERYRDLHAGAAEPAAPVVPTLTPAQEAAVEAVAAEPAFRVFLLHGVTGSGKTEVYLRLAARTLAAGRSVLVLVPEIALTHQLVQRMQERFGPAVAVLHSGLGPGERWDEWRRLARGEARIAVGTRSAVFAPMRDLGLVVVDEEHDAAYKQDEGLRYHGRDLAIVRGKLAGVPVVLGSATPSVESYQQALDGKFARLALPERVAGRPLPAVEIVDLRGAEARARDTTPESRLFSPALVAAMEETLARGEQTLLFLNRRGFANTVQCLACGEPAGCPGCSVTLTLHQRRGLLLCHHCGHARPATAPCVACKSRDVEAFGDGTERIEGEVARRFPAARVGRLDRDTTARKGAHRRILDAWRAGELDVLIGTQMVAKGHDVPGVTLVGVLLADIALNMPDFRAGERAFQLLTQVAGRAGRGERPGRVIVQTLRPAHHSLVAAARHDYAGFAPEELGHRRELGYPPFARLAVLRFEGADAAATERAAVELAARARNGDPLPDVTLRGPAPAPLERLRGRWRWQLLVSSPSAGALRGALRRLVAGWRSAAAARKIRLVVDVDPVSML